MKTELFGQKLNMLNEVHVSVVKYLQEEAKNMRKAKYLKQMCRGSLREEYRLYSEEIERLKAIQNNRNKKEIKANKDMLRDELIQKVLDKLVESIESGSLTINKTWLDYYKCTRAEMDKKQAKKMRI